MTLNEWAETAGLTDRQIAERMTDWLIENGHDDAVSVPAVQKYRHGRVPKEPRMQAIFAVTEGWVTANDFFALPVAWG
jgi:hypothetical protein